MNERLRFAFAFIRRHGYMSCKNMDQRFFDDLCQLCQLELVTLLVDYDGTFCYFTLKYPSDKM